ncbi:MAG: hypothetical protein AB8G86_23325 [Saprospiraceae bacterium]
MPNNILFVFEGEKTEKQITDSLTKYFINDEDNTIVRCVYCNDVYELHKTIAEDRDLDTFALLKEIPQNEQSLANYNRNDFAEIYLFFDYDGHDNLADDKKVKEILAFFNEETDAGKLYISYPMVEALKHIPKSNSFKDLKVPAKANIRYKQLVNSEAKNELKQLKKYTKNTWILLIELHLKKMNFILANDYVLPTKNSPQSDVFLKQLEKYITIDGTVAILSAFPIFLFDYYGYKSISELLAGKQK